VNNGHSRKTSSYFWERIEKKYINFSSIFQEKLLFMEQ
jgi:hypothetical protein